MLGSTLTKFLSQRSHKVTESNRTGIPVQLGNQVIKFDILKDDLEDLIGLQNSFDYVLNCAGLIKHKIDEKKFSDVLEWVLSSEFDTNLNGCVDHMWNGVTTLDFAKIVGGIIEGDNFKSGIQHLIPRDQVSKFELLNLISQTFNRKDLKVIPVESGHQINRTLGTLDLEANNKLWLNGGYSEPPTIADMIKGYATWLKETQ